MPPFHIGLNYIIDYYVVLLHEALDDAAIARREARIPITVDRGQGVKTERMKHTQIYAKQCVNLSVKKQSVWWTRGE